MQDSKAGESEGGQPGAAANLQNEGEDEEEDEDDEGSGSASSLSEADYDPSSAWAAVAVDDANIKVGDGPADVRRKAAVASGRTASILNGPTVFRFGTG